ncbi:DUF3231 family protein [Bacillus sp. FJAT-42376]|uniref:DUF3231 family protein n=1 Tax=Bacillus sp. FJAT-42376 TaxID=2014076 RepID=UPI000F4FB72D|nr:DUF3231 family protein [Bacillus sp. FJAT-42376]AZB40997.1 DUF3231 family protein [Bacillus sp. FJAT-42376]
MVQHNINLTTPEISALWTAYMQETASSCFLKHFLLHMEDEEIRPVVQEAFDVSVSSIARLKTIFEEENYPVPYGFGEADLDEKAPPLFTDLYALSYVYRVSQLGMMGYTYSFITVARKDLLDFFTLSKDRASQVYRKAVDLMLSKGIYDRPPKIPYPDQADFVQKDSFLNGWLKERPLNAFELGEAFFIIERNYIGMIHLLGLIQTCRDHDVRQFFIKGQKLAQKQIDTFNDLLKKEGHLGTLPVSMEVTASSVSPFSDKLNMFMITTSTTTAIWLLGRSLSAAMRRDVGAHYMLLMKDILLYVEEGAKLMMERGWLEQPPQAQRKI